MGRRLSPPFAGGAGCARVAALGLAVALLVAAEPVTAAAFARTAVETVLSGLETVWELAWGSDGRLYLSERSGRIRAWDGRRLADLATLPAVEFGEAGLMGLALDPAFPREPFVYACFTARRPAGQGGGLENRVERLRLEGERLASVQVVLDGMPAASFHDGCRLAFAPDGTLLVTMGDAGMADRAQDPRSLAGKVLRVHADGRIPSDNPFPGSPVFTLGHRNPQGLAVRAGTAEIYISEHGPDTDDEINRLAPGRNYGWPLVRGTARVAGYEPALWAWTPTIAPAAVAFTDPFTLYLATLKESRLHRLKLDEQGRVVGDEVVLEGYGRLRALAVGPDGCLYVGTSNRDGRGQVRPGDDRVLRVCLPGK